MEPKFLADSMLGKLARWLVLLGYDTRFAGEQGASDLEILERAHREGRIFLTRDTKIPEVKGLQKIVLCEQRFEAQLSHVLRALALRPERRRLFTRCTYCNQALDNLARDEALPQVPPLVRVLPTEFFRCSSCRRIYWSGTHTERMVQKLERMGLWGEGQRDQISKNP
jgi:uncharacterized protein with PIN domain